MTTDHTPALAAEVPEASTLEPKAVPAATPSASWRANGELDPHGNRYDCERAALAMGSLTDDELANGAFMNYDVRPPLQAIIDGKAYSPIAWMTAVKDRIRWLSRSLEKAVAAPPPVAPAPAEPRDTDLRYDLGPVIDLQNPGRGRHEILQQMKAEGRLPAAPTAVPARHEPAEGLGVAATPPGSTLQPSVSAAIPNAESLLADFCEASGTYFTETYRPSAKTRQMVSNPIRRDDLLMLIHEARRLSHGCEYCGDSGDVHGLDGEWRGICNCVAGLRLREGSQREAMRREAAQPAGQEPGDACGTRPEAADAATQPLRQPLTEAEIDKVLGAAYRKLVSAGYSGGMGSETWDRAAARAIEAHITTRSPKP